MINGIVLSGGGARCYAHLGVLQALEEHGIFVEAISATSAGSLAGAFYAAGVKPLEIKRLFDQYSIFSTKNMYLGKLGIFKTVQMETVIDTNLPVKTFEELRVRLFITATDVIRGRSVTFSSGEVLKPAVASCAIPFLFAPVSFNNTQWVDGGVMDNFPIGPLIGLCDRIFGSHVNPILTIEKTPLSRLQLLERCYHLAIANSLYAKEKYCVLFFEPPQLSGYSVFDQQKSSAIYQLGYEHASRLLDEFVK